LSVTGVLGAPSPDEDDSASSSLPLPLLPPLLLLSPPLLLVPLQLLLLPSPLLLLLQLLLLPSPLLLLLPLLPPPPPLGHLLLHLSPQLPPTVASAAVPPGPMCIRLPYFLALTMLLVNHRGLHAACWMRSWRDGVVCRHLPSLDYEWRRQWQWAIPRPDTVQHSARGHLDARAVWGQRCLDSGQPGPAPPPPGRQRLAGAAPLASNLQVAGLKFA
jgi:hypothetical protein